MKGHKQYTMHRSGVVKNVTVLNIAAIFTNLVVFITSMLLGRYLEKAEFGRFIFIFAFVALFEIFTDLGLSQLTTKEVSRNRKSAGKFLVNLSFIKLILCIVTFLAICLAAKILGFSWQIKIGLSIIGLSMLINSFGRFYGYLFNAFERMGYTAALSFLLKLFTLIGVFVLIKLHLGLISIYKIYLGSAALFTIISFIFLRKRFIQEKSRLDFSFCKEIIFKGLPFALFVLFSIVYTRIDVTLLKILKGEEATAIYGAANYILMAIMFIPANLSTALYPVFSRLYNNGKAAKEKLIQYYKKSLFYLIILALPIGLGITLLSEKIVLLIWTKKYIESALVLKILVWRTAIQYLTSILTFLMLAIDRQKITTIFIFFLALFNILLNFILIPSYSYIGASFAALISMGLYFILFFGYISKNLYKINLKDMIVKPLLAASLLGVFIHIFQHLNLLVLISISAAFYFSIMILLNGLKIKDLDK